MIKENMNQVQLFNCDFKERIAEIPDNSVKAIITDPPYLYLKHKLDIPFDEEYLFTQAKRILRDDGFIVLFGRGTSFYRWNTILADLGFIFKEEIIWDKSYISSPLMAISRVHETISIFTKKSGKINKVKIPYLEMKSHNIDSIITDIKRLKTAFNNIDIFNQIISFFENNKVEYDNKCTYKYTLSASKKLKQCRCAVSVAQSVKNGLNEKSIIKEIRDPRKTIHPTQKPVRLLERLLMLTTSENDLIVDPFFGSCSTGIACKNLNRNFIGYEIDKDYFLAGEERINNHILQEKLYR